MSDWKNVQYKDGKMRTSEGGGGGGSSTFAGLTDVNFSDLQDGQVPKYNSTTEKWENADESGGGASHTYSTTEQVVDTWIDGKPVYELIVHSTGLAPEVNVETNIADLSAYNIDTIISLQAIDRWQRTSGNIDMSVPNGDYFLPFYRHTTKYLMFRQSYAGSATNDMYIILRYTKTTD